MRGPSRDSQKEALRCRSGGYQAGGRQGARRPTIEALVIHPWVL